MSLKNASKADNFFGQENPSPSLFVLVLHHVVMTSRQRTGGGPYGWSTTQYTIGISSRSHRCVRWGYACFPCARWKRHLHPSWHMVLLACFDRNFKAMLCKHKCQHNRADHFLEPHPIFSCLPGTMEFMWCTTQTGFLTWFLHDLLTCLYIFMFPYRFVRVTTVRLLVTRSMHLPVSLLVRAKRLGSDRMDRIDYWLHILENHRC